MALTACNCSGRCYYYPWRVISGAAIVVDRPEHRQWQPDTHLLGAATL